jgi:hypothetical protein
MYFLTVSTMMSVHLSTGKLNTTELKAGMATDLKLFSSALSRMLFTVLFNRGSAH